MGDSETFTAQVVSARRITIPYELCVVKGIREGDFVKVKLVSVTKFEETSKPEVTAR
jgi:bifunctional DNA-binding transcriptional regulator/antitoxin component of YhaV-PrlF toxin-antitoxin module